jgi:hypothetical protein
MSKKTQKTEKVPAQAEVVKPVIDWAAIAALEKQSLETAKQSEPLIQSEPVSLSFEDWWLLRESALNKPQHYKEILKADFGARGLGKKEPLERWDWAGKQFGLKW